MSKVNYSKKQLEPLIRKYGINPETNTLFQNIIKMFNETPNYQIWAVKAIFSKNLIFDDLVKIKQWSDENKNLIKHLNKKNIVAYSSITDFRNLFSEIEGLNMIMMVKNLINRFNTDQRHMLEENLKLDALNGVTAKTNKNFMSWFKIFDKFNKLPESRKKKFISLCSAFRNLDDMKNGLKKSTEETYQWNKEDLLAFMANNCPNCSVIFDSGDIVILNVPDFESSRKLCGGGRTKWCITREEHFFTSYVTGNTNPSRKQYFLFDFSKPETDELAHIGLTVTSTGQFHDVQSCQNYSLLGNGISYHGHRVNINQVFDKLNIKKSVFLNFSAVKGFEWNYESFVRFVDKNSNDLSIAYAKDGRIIIKPLTQKGLSLIAGHTFIPTNNYNVGSDKRSIYVLMDFNAPMEDDNSVVLMIFSKDAYGFECVEQILDAFGANITSKEFLSKINISYDDFLHRDNIDPSILLHKLINEGDERAAIELINKSDDKLDINFDFNGTLPIFKIVSNNMIGAFKAIINNKNFDMTKTDGCEETLLSSLLYNYGLDDMYQSKQEETNLQNMISIVLESKNADFNVQDINLQTPLIVAANWPKTLWVLEALVNNPTVNVNVIDDFNRTALTTAIKNNNIEAIKILGKRPDLVIRDEDIKKARQKGINLNELIHPVADMKLDEKSTENHYSQTTKMVNEILSALR